MWRSLSQRTARPTARAAAAFTLVEIMIVVVILGILATIVIPHVSSASHQAREVTLRDDVRFMRTQIIVYKAQHRDAAPGYPGGNTSAYPTEATFVEQMTKFTSATGATSATASAVFEFGPYLTKMPVNPMNQKNTIRMIANGAPIPAPTGAYGWIYKPETEEIIPDQPGVDLNGIPYVNY